MNEQKIHIVLQSIIVLLAVWLVNQVADRSNVRLDLTEEKRYTISDATKSLLENLNEDVFFEVYLAGDLPPNFKRFSNSIQEMLEQFGQESGDRIQYKFTDPTQAQSTQARNQFFQALMEKGLQPTNLNFKQDGNNLQKIIFPAVLVSQGMQEIPVNLLKGNRASGHEEFLNQAIEGLEYELASAISQLGDGGIKKVGFVTGHGTPEADLLAGFKNAILSKYDLFDVRLEGRKELVGYDAVVIAKPRDKFTEEEKYLLDQYLMRGGSLIFFIDALSVDIDGAFSEEGTVAIPYETNLEDLLFKYGVRVNRNFVLDINSVDMPVVLGNIGDQPQIQMLTWPFFPLITNFSAHPSVRNLDGIITRFTSTIDTVKAAGVKKTPLAATTAYSKVLGPPVRVAISDLEDELNPERFNGGVQNIAYLLEGKFTSLYANRIVPRGFDKSAFMEKSEDGKVIVFADGDMIINEIDPESQEPLALGVEGYTKTTYANEQLVLNILDYMVDASGLIETRSREVKVRPLDKVKLKQGRTKWQLINLVLPVVLILIAGGLKWYLRKRKFAN
ncbi:MAG: gliding motility-associated ABC transporter substrate-binding protein GldG [Cyclobacteriaceae bacterium]